MSYDYLSIRDNIKAKMRVLKIGFILLAVIYSVITLMPFYFAFIRSFVPSKEAGELHLWIPEKQEFNLDIKYGNMNVYYNINLDKFKKDLGIEDVKYINPNLTLRQISEKYNIPEQKIKDYLAPYYLYGGWITILQDKFFYKALYTTFLITLSSIILGGLLAMATGYVLAGFKKKWHYAMYIAYMLSMVVPRALILLPLYLMVTRFLNLGNHGYLAIVLIFIQGGCLPVMIFTNYISKLPLELEESVKIDGGSKLTYYFRILLPLCKPAFAAYAAIHIPLFWNDLLMGLLFLKKSQYTLAPYLQKIQGAFTTNYQPLYGGLVLSIIPILIFYLIFNDLFLKAQLSGAVKG